jgi:diadenosine tetraphosphatase ApaH/serine/threonine PP2A family protein phosphatase
MQAEEITGWVNEAVDASAEAFHDLLTDAIQLLAEEQRARNGSGLVRIEPQMVRSVAVIGDIHGDLESLVQILTQHEVLNADRIIFLGDYGDRGEASVQVYYVLLRLKLAAGRAERVLLLRGNHEGPPDLHFRPHELPYFFTEKYGAQGMALYRAVKALWEQLPCAVLMIGRYLMLHGGVPVSVTSLDEIAYAHEAHPETSVLRELLWNDPLDGQGWCESFRGAGKLFGENVTDAVLRLAGVKTLIRSHEPCEGVQVRQGGRILTLFSRTGAPYYNQRAAYLLLDESSIREPKDANELARMARFVPTSSGLESEMNR